MFVLLAKFINSNQQKTGTRYRLDCPQHLGRIIIDRNGMRDSRNVERICEEDEKAGNASFCRTELEPCDKLPSWL